MILSEERQSHFAKLIVDGLWKADLVDYTEDDVAMRAAKRAILSWVKNEEKIDEKVRSKIQSLKKTVTEGTSEWDIMYRKYYEEETNKRGY